MTVVMEFSRKKTSKGFSAWYASTKDDSSDDDEELSSIVEGLKRCPRPTSERDAITLAVLRAMSARDTIPDVEIAPFLLHTAALKCLPLSSRSLTFTSESVGYDGSNPERSAPSAVVESFSETAAAFFQLPAFVDLLDAVGLLCDVSDLLDGRLFAKIVQSNSLQSDLLAQDGISEHYQQLCSSFSRISEENLSDTDLGCEANNAEAETEAQAEAEAEAEAARSYNQDPLREAVLPFNNFVFDSHLAPISINVEENTSSQRSLAQAKVFKELSHWHNHRKAITKKGPPPAKDAKAEFWARRRNQWFMAEMLSYAASLTNAAGKVLEPEIIVVTDITKQPKHAKQLPSSAERTSKPKDKPAKGGKKPGQTNKKGGRAAALEAAAARKAEKVQSKSEVVAAFWGLKCKDLLKEDNPRIRHLNTKKYFDSLSKEDASILGPEIELFMINSLLQVWAESRIRKNASPDRDILALIWDSFLRLSKAGSGMTKTVADSLGTISKALGLPTMAFKESTADRSLPFSLTAIKAAKLQAADLSVDMPTSDFQLEYCGQYFDRSFDSAPDSRVPFTPDGWQRKVLDVIDDDKSLFVVAPTSAGKPLRPLPSTTLAKIDLFR
jgi:ATP-dependent RNA helicase DDX60